MSSEFGQGLPAAGVVHLVFHELPDSVQPHEWAALNGEEHARAARYVFERDRARFVSARHRLRELLGHHLGLAPAAVPLTVQAHGKPVLNLPEPLPLHFNLSHSQGLALLAFSSSGAVGVDLEHIRPDRNLPGLARTVFSAAEQAQWAALPVDAQPAAFTQLWARKEAVLKAWGCGLRVEPASLHLGLHLGLHTEAQTVTGRAEEHCGTTWLRTVPAGDACAAALASLQPVQQVHIQHAPHRVMAA